MIKKIDDLYYVFGESGKKLSNGYKTEDEAKERLKEIETFKDKAADDCPCKKKSFQDRAFTLDMTFTDNQTLESKRVISVRDGYQEYLGIELGLEPSDKVFTIYRSPETIKLLNDKLKDIPLTIEHIDDLDKSVPESEKVGKIVASKVINSKTKDKDSTINLENEIYTDENKLKYNEYKQLSLGYKATTLPHSKYDFEQIDIVPHHLAIVEKGRCGDGCKFLDKQGVTNMTLEELIAMLKEKLGEAKEEDKQMVMDEMKDMFPSKEDTKDEDMEKMKDEAKEEAKKEYADSLAKVKAETLKNFQDSAIFKQAMLDAGNERVSVISKAVNYLDKAYKFEQKQNLEIMKDVLKAEYPTETFNDAEISVAFKMLKEKAKIEESHSFNDSDFKSISDTFDKEF